MTKRYELRDLPKDILEEEIISQLSPRSRQAFAETSKRYISSVRKRTLKDKQKIIQKILDSDTPMNAIDETSFRNAYWKLINIAKFQLVRSVLPNAKYDFIMLVTEGAIKSDFEREFRILEETYQRSKEFYRAILNSLNYNSLVKIINKIENLKKEVERAMMMIENFEKLIKGNANKRVYMTPGRHRRPKDFDEE